MSSRCEDCFFYNKCDAVSLYTNCDDYMPNTLKTLHINFHLSEETKKNLYELSK